MAAGKGSSFLLKDNSTGTPATIGGMRSTSMTINGEMVDITTKDSSGRQELLTGLTSFSLSSDGLMDFNPTTAANTGFDELFNQAYTNRTKVTFVFTLASTASGDYTFSGSGAITALSISGGVEDAPTYSVSIQGSGALTKNDI